MRNERDFYRCSHCGNLVMFVENAGAKIICCGEPMSRLSANTEDAAREKHVPALSLKGKTLEVAVGSVGHPMTQEHHIAWMAVAESDRTQLVNLPETGQPEAELCVNSEQLTVYAYCNLHGLWASDL